MILEAFHLQAASINARRKTTKQSLKAPTVGGHAVLNRLPRHFVPPAMTNLL